MTVPFDPTNPSTNPITATLHLPKDPDARVDLLNLTCEPVAALFALAILYAAGRTDAARQGLEDLCVKAKSDERPWQMLFDLHRALNHRDAFEALLPLYRRRFAQRPEPIWDVPESAMSSRFVQFSGVLDGREGFADFLEQARARRLVMIDLERVTRIDFSFAPRFCAALRLMVLQHQRVIIANVSELHAQLFEIVGLHSGVGLIRRSGADLAVIDIDSRALAAA